MTAHAHALQFARAADRQIVQCDVTQFVPRWRRFPDFAQRALVQITDALPHLHARRDVALRINHERVRRDGARARLGCQFAFDPQRRVNRLTEQPHQIVVRQTMLERIASAIVFGGDGDVVAKPRAQRIGERAQGVKLAYVLAHQRRLEHGAHAALAQQLKRAHRQLERARALRDAFVRLGVRAIHADFDRVRMQRGDLIRDVRGNQDAVGEQAQQEFARARVLRNLKPIVAHQHLTARQREVERAQVRQFVNHAETFWRRQLVERGTGGRAYIEVAVRAFLIAPIRHFPMRAEQTMLLARLRDKVIVRCYVSGERRGTFDGHCKSSETVGQWVSETVGQWVNETVVQWDSGTVGGRGG
mgnify:CR=1 FL=1